jgi:hypothetical protein
VDYEGVTTPAASAREPAAFRFRLSVVVVSVVAAAVGSVVLATRDHGQRATTRGITATFRVPGHPGPVAAGADVLWVALNGDPSRTAGDRPLLRLDLATGTVVQAVDLGGEVTYLMRDGGRLIASVKPVGGGALGSRRLVALDWRSGGVLPLGDSHFSDADAREINGPVDQIVRNGDSMWALELQPGRLVQLDASTLTPFPARIRLSSGRTLGLAAGDGHLWVTASDAGQILRIDPATRAVTRVHVGGFPVGIAVADGNVWYADRSNGSVVRLDRRTLRPPGDRIRVGGKPTWLALAGNSVFVTDENAGTVAQIDAHSGRQIGPPIQIAPAANAPVAPALAPSGGSVWVSSFASDVVTRITSPASRTASSSEMTVNGTGDGPVNDVTNGGVAGTGHFSVTGAINDRGTYIGYRSVRGHVAKVRNVLIGKKGTITIVITIRLGTESPAPWTIVSGTKSYVGVHATGRLIVDNYWSNPYTFVLSGTVSR